jgi:uncharacterized FlgJ-related protein
MFDHIKKTEDGYRRACERCGGLGTIEEYRHIFDGECYKCLGVGAWGKAFATREGLEAHLAKLAVAREKREAKLEAERLAEWEAGRAQREAEEAKLEAERLAYEAELAQWKYLDAREGEKVTVEGVVAVSAVVETQWGTSKLIVIETPQREAVKLFTSAEWAWSVERDEALTVTGAVKSFAEYAGKPQTVLNRPKRLA